ncbi:MAG: hemin-degrading factor [Rhodospirillales bacterium]|nr:hemin-degrading factor [Rhodospirillales bacterium]
MPRPSDLADRRATLAAAEPRLYPRDLAARLGVTEADIVAPDDGHAATRLRPDWRALLGGLHRLGPVMALTRNADAVHEKHGTYGALQGGGQVALFVGEAIDLRLFLGNWCAAWAVEQNGRRSLQCFAADGTAVHKVFATAETDADAWASLVATHAEPGLPPFAAAAPTPPAASRDDAAIDIAGLRAAWDALRDTHAFHALLGRFGVARTQALRLAGPARARPVAATALRAVLLAASATAMPVMVFVGNPGCIQIHSGPVRALRETGPWFNVLDPGFSLHLRETAIDTAWVVTKPTDDGTVTSLVLFDAAGATIAMLFGARNPGRPELADWRALCAGLPPR